MRKICILLLVAVCFYNCNRKKTIEFVTLDKSAFNSKPFPLFDGRIPDSLKRNHDSCMGFSFDANVILARSTYTFFIGSIVNRQTLKIVNTLGDLGFAQDQMISKFNILSSSCYEKRTLDISLKSILGENFALQLPGGSKTTDDEINNDILNARDATIRTGQWVYLDFKNGLSNIFDTAISAAGLNYKANLINPDNMVFAATEGITNISFIINTEKDMSDQLLALLQQKPYAILQNARFTIRFFYIDSRTFQMDLDGFFPMAGQFVKAELR